MKRLIIAEKPSVALSIASVLGVKDKKDGYVENSSYVVSWCFGHLTELAGPEAYDERYGKWCYDDLPIVPANWRSKVSGDKHKQFELLKTLMNRADISEVVNACDAGREGELIFRNVYASAGCTKPILRLWISSMEDSAIRQGFSELKPGAEYDNLYAAAKCRDKADWLVGINATRLFSVLYHRTLNVGRVMSPTLAMLVQREAEIEAFKPEAFFTVNLDCGKFTAVSDKYKDKATVQKLAAACKGQSVVVKAIERKEKSEKAPALYDLTTLQRDANRLLGYTAQQTLDYAQSMYEKKLLTYPRTDSRYLTDDMEDSVRAIVLCAAGILDVDTPAVINPAQVCNSKKVSDHHAIIPTMFAGESDLSALPSGERELLLLVARQVMISVCEAHRYAETTVTLDCGGNIFSVKGKTVLVDGWKAYLPRDKEDTALPELTEKQTVPVSDVSVHEGKTTPPKHYTEDTLLSAMENAGAKDMPEDAERKGLGTPATRAAILEKLVSTGFIERQKAKKTVSLVPAHVGVSLITVLPEELQSPLLTAEWESRLKQVERGELDADEFMRSICLMINRLVKTYAVIKGAEVLFPSGRPVVGKCPRCGSDVTESKKGFFCERADCHFGLWRDNKFLTSKRVKLTKRMAEALLKDGRVPVKDLFSEKTGKSYDAVLALTDDGAKSVYGLDFGKEGN